MRYGYAKIRARWRVSRGWTAAFLALWFVSASFALARSDLNRFLYLKAQGIPDLMAGISSLGYQISEKRLTPYQGSGLWEFRLSTTGQEPWILFVVYFPPFKPIDQWPRTDSSKLDLKYSTGSARLYYQSTPNKPDPAPPPTAFVQTVNRIYAIAPYEGDLDSHRDLYALLMREELPPAGWFQETRTYWNIETGFFRWLSAYCSHHPEGILDIPAALLPLSAMLWAPAVALLPAGTVTSLPSWLLIVFLVPTLLVTVWWLRLTRPDQEKGDQV